MNDVQLEAPTGKTMFFGDLDNPQALLSAPAPAGAILSVSACASPGAGSSVEVSVGWRVTAGNEVAAKLPLAQASLGSRVPMPAVIEAAWKAAGGSPTPHLYVVVEEDKAKKAFWLRARAQPGDEILEEYLAREQLRSLRSVLTFAGPVVRMAVAGPGSNDILDIMEQTSAAPPATALIEVPQTPMPFEMTLVNYAMVVESYVSLLTSLHLNKAHPGIYDITNPADKRQFIADYVNWKYYVLMGKSVKVIPALLPMGNVLTFKKHISTTSGNLHGDLLHTLFAGMGLSDDAFKQLDAVLTEVTNNIADVRPGATETVDHLISYYAMGKVEGTGVNDVPRVPVIKFKQFYIRIDKHSWEQIIDRGRKQSPDRSIVVEFDVDFFVTEAVMSTPIAQKYLSAMEEQITTVTKKDYKAVAALLKTKGITKKDPPQ